MKKIIPLICFFLLGACSGSRYYFHKRIRPAEPKEEKNITMPQVPRQEEVFTPVKKEKGVVVKEEIVTVPVAVQKTYLIKKKDVAQGQTITAQGPMVDICHPIFPSPNNYRTRESHGGIVPSNHQLSSAGTANKLGPLAIFFIVLGGIEVLTFVIALLLGCTLLQALQAMLIVLILVVVLLLYTALKSW